MPTAQISQMRTLETGSGIEKSSLSYKLSKRPGPLSLSLGSSHDWLFLTFKKMFSMRRLEFLHEIKTRSTQNVVFVRFWTKMSPTWLFKVGNDFWARSFSFLVRGLDGWVSCAKNYESSICQLLVSKEVFMLLLRQDRLGVQNRWAVNKEHLKE